MNPFKTENEGITGWMFAIGIFAAFILGVIITGIYFDQNPVIINNGCESTHTTIVQNNTANCPKTDCVNEILNQNARLEDFKKEIIK